MAQVELTSEDATDPIEFALLPGQNQSGELHHTGGADHIRLIFDQPQRLGRIWLLFIEPEIARTQVFVLRWSSDGGRPFLKILRQQWNFSLPGAIREVEDYYFELWCGTARTSHYPGSEGRCDVRASLAQLRLAIYSHISVLWSSGSEDVQRRPEHRI